MMILYQKCSSRHDTSTHMGPKNGGVAGGRGLIFSILIEILKIRLKQNKGLFAIYGIATPF